MTLRRQDVGLSTTASGATGGSFASVKHPEGSPLDTAVTTSPPRPMSTALAYPLTMKELGMRTDHEGRAQALMVLRPQEMDSGNEQNADHVLEEFAGPAGMFLSDLRIEPVTVTAEGSILCNVSADASDLENYVSAAEEEELHQGRIERHGYLWNQVDSKQQLHLHMNSGSLLEDASDFSKPPSLPEGYENPEITFGYDRYSDAPQITYHWPDGSYIEHSPSVDGVSDSHTDPHMAGELTEETLDAINDHIWEAGQNYSRALSWATYKLQQNDNFISSLQNLVLNGTNNDN